MLRTQHHLTRRRLVAAAAVVTGGLLSGAAPALAGTGAGFSASDRALVLRLARIGAVFPVPFPAFGEHGSAQSRVNDRRLRTALDATRQDRAADALDVIHALRADGSDQFNDVALVVRLAEVSAAGRSRSGLVALTAIGIAAVSTRFDPNSDDAAAFWLDVLDRMHAAGTLRAQLGRAGVM